MVHLHRPDQFLVILTPWLDAGLEWKGMADYAGCEPHVRLNLFSVLKTLCNVEYCQRPRHRQPDR